MHVKRLGFGGNGWPFKDGRAVKVERVLRFILADGEWVYNDDGDVDRVEDGADASHRRTFSLRAILVHLGGARFALPPPTPPPPLLYAFLACFLPLHMPIAP